MSKIIYVCYREKTISLEVEERIKAICKELNAENISSRATKIHVCTHSIYGLSNPGELVEYKGNSISLGYIFSQSDNWDIPHTEPPDGNFAIFRNDGTFFEAVTDCMATRTIWYYFDEKMLITSTSQKSIVRFLGNFEFNERVIPWVLSTGSLGPSLSWDRRIKPVPANGKITLNKEKWELNKNVVPVIFKQIRHSRKHHKAKLEKAIQQTFKNLKIDLSKWAITLSGGHDSRAILLFLKKFSAADNKKIKTVTWGKDKIFLKNCNDAYIAYLLSKREGTDHGYYTTATSQIPVDEVINRFLHNGEGRIDHISGYMDGFELWKKMYESPLEGLIRGDEAFGYSKTISSLMVKQAIGITLCSDFENLKKYKYIRELKQEIPSSLKKKPGESCALWRDRLYHSFRIPVLISSLADLKYSYLEQINPFLSRKIVMTVRDIPDNLRTNKRLFKKIIKPLDSGIPYAKKGSSASFEKVVERKDFVDVLQRELSSKDARSIFPEEFLNDVKQNLKSEMEGAKINEKVPFITKIKMLIPSWIKIYLSSSKTKLFLNENILAFRILIISRMHKSLNKSAKSHS